MTRPVAVVMLSLLKHDNHHFRQHKKQKTPGINIHGVFHLKVVELEGIEPSSRDATTGAFYMFISVCCRDGAGTEITLLHPYPAC